MKWTEDLIRAEALKFGSKSEFQKKSRSACGAARRLNIFEDVCSHMSGNIKWTTESIHNEALLYSTKAEFEKGSKKAYARAKKRKIIDFVCSHMNAQCIYWTTESLHSEALKFTSRKDFEKGNRSAYFIAVKRKLLDEICSHMNPCYIYWTIESIHTEALRFTTRKKFYLGSQSAYQAAKKRGILNEVCGHMKPVRIYWTNESIREEALKFNTRTEFMRGSKAYRPAFERGMLDDGITCSHMIDAYTGFNPNIPGIVYYIKFDIPGDLPLYKIGITNLTSELRLKRLRAKKEIISTIIKEIWFEKGSEALQLEKKLHKEFSEYKYYGDPILENGNTELFIADVFQFNTITAQY